MSSIRLIVETIGFGILLIPFIHLAGYIVKHIGKKPTLPEICSTWNEYYIMELNVFIAGILFYIFLLSAQNYFKFSI